MNKCVCLCLCVCVCMCVCVCVCVCARARANLPAGAVCLKTNDAWLRQYLYCFTSNASKQITCCWCSVTQNKVMRCLHCTQHRPTHSRSLALYRSLSRSLALSVSIRTYLPMHCSSRQVMLTLYKTQANSLDPPRPPSVTSPSFHSEHLWSLKES
jgi:hypothetical protein